MKNLIGIEKSKAEKLSEKLNTLLSNYQIYYQNLRGFHWNIAGPSFFELHAKFEELYTGANTSIDDIAERILTLGSTPLHTFEDYWSGAAIKAAKNVKDGTETVKTTIANLGTLIELEREILSLANEADDEGTATLMSDYIKEQEKTVWMLSAYAK